VVVLIAPNLLSEIGFENLQKEPRVYKPTIRSKQLLNEAPLRGAGYLEASGYSKGLAFFFSRS